MTDDGHFFWHDGQKLLILQFVIILRNNITMKRYRLFLIASILMSLSLGARAQYNIPDTELMNLKGNVKSVGTFTHGIHGRVVGQPTLMCFREDGFLNQTFYCDTAGAATLLVQYFYDKKNRLLKDTRSRMGTNELLAVTTYTYDKKNRSITADVLVVTDSINDHRVTTFDKDDRVKRVALYDEQDTLLSAETYVYDAHGRIATATFTGTHDRYLSHVNFRYDADGNEIMQINCNLNRVTQQLFHVYTFDEQGNWIERRTFNLKGNTATLQETVNRTIEYYE